MSHDIPEPAEAVYEPPSTRVFVEPTPFPRDADLPSGDPSVDASTTDVAKEQATSLGKGTADAGKHVAGVAKDQASVVASETTRQAKDLLSQTLTELQGQAATQQARIAAGIRSLSSELGSMAQRSDQSGTTTDLVRQVSDRADDIAGWLEARDPGALLQEVTAFARRRPAAFLAIAAGAGLLAGRLTRGTIDAARDDDAQAPTPATDSHLAHPVAAPLADERAYVSPAFAAGGVEVEPVREGQARL